jgi:predicted O-methyltransferase YrrM
MNTPRKTDDASAAFFSSIGVSLEDAETRLEAVWPDWRSPCAIRQYFRGKGHVEVLYFSALSIADPGMEEILEIGTGMMETSLLIARLWPEAQVLTVDLPRGGGRNYHRPREPVQYEQVGRFDSDDPADIEKFRRNQEESPDNLSLLETDSFFLLKELNCTMGLVEVDGGLSVPTFDLVYVDAGHHYPSVSWDLMVAYNILKPGGWMLMDDYYDGVIKSTGQNFDVKHAVDTMANIVPERVDLLPLHCLEYNCNTHPDRGRMGCLRKNSGS